MSTPQGWQTPKTNWQSPDPVGLGDFNRIEGNTSAIETGDRTLDPAQAPTGNVGNLRQILGWFANRIKAITGTTNWYNAPPTTLDALNKRNIIAGNGLNGGGTLAADRTLTLGTPSTVGPTSNNSVTSTSHTHKMDPNYAALRRVTASNTVRHEALTRRAVSGNLTRVKRFCFTGTGTVRITGTFESVIKPQIVVLVNTIEVYNQESPGPTTSFSIDVPVFGGVADLELLVRGVSGTSSVKDVRVRYSITDTVSGVTQN